jgi:hypothetical protein
MVGNNIFFNHGHLVLCPLKFFDRFNIVHFLVKSRVGLLRYLFYLIRSSLLFRVVVNIEGPIAPEEEGVHRGVILVRDGLPLQGPTNHLAIGLVAARAGDMLCWLLCAADHLLQALRVSSVVDQGLDVILVDILQVQLAYIFQQGAVFAPVHILVASHRLWALLAFV